MRRWKTPNDYAFPPRTRRRSFNIHLSSPTSSTQRKTYWCPIPMSSGVVCWIFGFFFLHMWPPITHEIRLGSQGGPYSLPGRMCAQTSVTNRISILKHKPHAGASHTCVKQTVFPLYWASTKHHTCTAIKENTYRLCIPRTRHVI